MSFQLMTIRTFDLVLAFIARFLLDQEFEAKLEWRGNSNLFYNLSPFHSGIRTDDLQIACSTADHRLNHIKIEFSSKDKQTLKVYFKSRFILNKNHLLSTFRGVAIFGRIAKIRCSLREECLCVFLWLLSVVFFVVQICVMLRSSFAEANKCVQCCCLIVAFTTEHVFFCLFRRAIFYDDRL